VDLKSDERLQYPHPPRWQYSSRIRPCWGERLSGDAVVIQPLERGMLVAIVDVLGHGPEAHELTHVIDSYLTRYPSFDVTGLMRRLHQHLNGTRGAAVGLCAIHTDRGRVDYASIGNTVMRTFGETENRFVSQEGVLGQNMRTPRLQSLQLEPGDLITLYTDGVSDRFSAIDYPAILWHTPEEVVGNVVQRFGKDHDDAACIAVKYSA
jgi:serine phosphatase RsbU (regulator of sigma subunit)